MGRPVARLGLVISAVFVAGFGAGYGFRALTTRLARSPTPERAPPLGTGPAGQRDAVGSGSFARPPWETLYSEPGGPRDLEKEEAPWRRGPAGEKLSRENPFRGLSADELETRLLEALERRDHEVVELAVEALAELGPEHADRLADLLRRTPDPRVAEDLARRLVRRGGWGAVEVVARLAGEEGLDVGLRRGLLHALGEMPDEHRQAGQLLLQDLLLSDLPVELQFPAAHSYGQVLGKGAVTGLLELVGEPGARRQPLLEALRDFARQDDLPLLVGFLGETMGREEQETLLRAIGGASGADGGAVLLDLFEYPPEGVGREAVGRALDEFARKEDLPRLWENLLADRDRATQAALARTVARVGGIEEVRRLMELAGDPASGLSWDSLGGALEGCGNQEMAPLLEEVLRGSRTWEGAHPLARELVRISGPEGLQTLLDLAAEPAGGERRMALVQTVEDFGDPSVVDRLRDMLAREREHGVAFHIAKAILRLDPDAGPTTLAERLGDLPEGDGRAAVATLLEREGTVDLIPTLTRALSREEHGRAQWHLARAIASLGPEGVGAIGELLSSDPSPQRRAEVLRGLESAPADGVIPIARSMLKDPAPSVRASAAKVLAGSGDPAARDDLRAAFSSEADGEVRGLLGELLGEKRQP